jgi:hypothetical protein
MKLGRTALDLAVLFVVNHFFGWFDPGRPILDCFFKICFFATIIMVAFIFG